MIKRKGVSLPELLVVCFLVGVLVTMALSSGNNQPQAQALAGELAAQLRAARQRAMARQEMVGMVMPGPVSLSVSGLEGPVIGRLVRTHDWASEYPRARLLAEPGPLSETYLTWLAGRQTLPAVVFDPSGRSHGVRKFVVAGPGSQEVNVTLQGTVTMRPSAEAPPTGEVSEPLRIVHKENIAPVILDVAAAPTVGAQLLPNEVTAIVPNGGHITLTVRARDNDWDRLYVTWECDEAQGTFSTPGEQPMVWDGDQWVGTTQFRPSDAMQGMQKIPLRCRVRDEDGRINAGGAAASRVLVAVGMPGKLAFWGRAPGTQGDPGLWTCSPEGHSVRQVLPLVTEYATVSWDGMKAVFGSHTEGVIVSNLDGSERTEALPAPYSYASLSPNGKYLAAFHMTPSDNVHLVLPRHLRKSANTLPWYPDRLVVINRHGVHLVDIPVPFAPGALGEAEFPTVTLPQIVWSAENDQVYFLYGQRQDVVGALPLIDPTLHSVTLADPPVEKDSPWPGALGLQMHGSPTPHEIRSNDEQVLEGFRPGPPGNLVHVREWTGGGKARRPAGSSLYDGKSVILSGFVQETENVEGGVVLSLWRKGEATACRLLLKGVEPFNDVITWTE